MLSSGVKSFHRAFEADFASRACSSQRSLLSNHFLRFTFHQPLSYNDSTRKPQQRNHNTERSQRTLRQKVKTNFKHEEREVAEVRDLQALAWNDVRLSSVSSADSCSNLSSLCVLCDLSVYACCISGAGMPRGPLTNHFSRPRSALTRPAPEKHRQ